MMEDTRHDQVAVLTAFDVSPITGFVPEEKPLCRLPAYFSNWEEVCEKLPELWKTGKIRSAIDTLPLLNYDRLSSEGEWCRASVVLSFLSHSYVWCQGEQGAAKVLPMNLSIPWTAVTRHLGLSPILVHYSYVLYNWKILDHNRPLHMDNIEPLNTFTGTKSEDGFITATVQIELEFGKSVQSIIEVQKAVLADDIEKVQEELVEVQGMISRLKTALLKMHDVCDPGDFYFSIRTFLNGWHNNAALPDGLIYEGVSPTPQQYPGGSAAESTVFQVLDAFLGIQHFRSPSKQSFLEQMRHHMPPKHRAFIIAVQEGPQLREFVLQSRNTSLVERYNACVEALQEYRNTHLQIVTKYIIIQASKDPDNPNRVLAKQGTGGSDLMKFLQRIRNETKDMRIPLDDNGKE